jgi:hypothetical protein
MRRIHHAFLAFAVLAAGAFATMAEAAPDTTLKDLMKKMNTSVLNGDTKGLGAIFDATKAKGKPEFANWGSLADKGKAAAEKGDMDGVKATCKPCHDAYRGDYKTKYGSKAP